LAKTAEVRRVGLGARTPSHFEFMKFFQGISEVNLLESCEVKPRLDQRFEFVRDAFVVPATGELRDLKECFARNQFPFKRDNCGWSR